MHGGDGGDVAVVAGLLRLIQSPADFRPTRPKEVGSTRSQLWMSHAQGPTNVTNRYALRKLAAAHCWRVCVSSC